MRLDLKNLSYIQKVVSSMVEEILIETEVLGDIVETDSDSLIGTPGRDGATFIPSVSEEGIISWTNDKDLENPTPVNIKGKDGEKGETGDAFTYDMFTPEQLENLKGDKGDKGEVGIGVPVGGKAGQILAKISDDDYDTEWRDNTGIDVKVPTKVSELENDKHYVSTNDLTDYATKEYVNEEISKIEITGENIDLSDYALKEELPTKLSELENDSGYVTNTDYASSDNVGLVKTESYYGLHTSSRNGTLYCEQFSYDEYTNDKDGNCFVGKGTLENVLEAKDYASKEYVGDQISNIDIGGGVDLSDYAKKEDLDNKTNTSVLPNDFGDVKTRFRICNKAEDESPVIYFPLVKLPKDNSKNSASVILKGRVGGFLSKDMAMINALIWNRTTTGISLFNINADTYTLEEPLRLCDIVVYTNDDTTDTVYLKCREWYVFDIDLEVYQSTAEILYDGTYLTEEPTGTLSATASTSDKRVEVYDGKLYVNGNEISGGVDLTDYATKEYVDEKIENIEITGGTGGSDYELPIASSSTLGGIKVGANLTIDDEGVLSATGGSGSSLDNYSTEEQVIGTWFGKPLYRKVVQYTLTATDGYPQFDTGIRDIDYAMIDMYKSDGGSTNTNYFRTTPAISCYLNKSNGLFTLANKSVNALVCPSLGTN